MRFARLMAIIGAVVGGYLAVAPASAAPFSATTPVAETSAPAEAYMHYRRYRHRHYAPRRSYRRYYAPRRGYYAPRRSYRRYYAPRRMYYAPRRSYRRVYRSYW
jgi:hypothetical protein